MTKQPMHIKNVTKNEIPDIFRIVDSQFGQGYIQAEQFSDPQNIALCACEEHVTGFFLGRVSSLSEFRHDHPNIPSKYFLDLQPSDKIGFLASLAIAPHEQKKGIGSVLTTKLLEKIHEQGAQISFATAWKSPEGVNAHGILLRHGFQEIAELPEYYKEHSLKYDSECPACGKPPCMCSAVLYMRKT